MDATVSAAKHEKLRYDIRSVAENMLWDCCTNDYSKQIWDIIGTDVEEDVLASSAASETGKFSDSDIALAIGRALLKKLGQPA